MASQGPISMKNDECRKELSNGKAEVVRNIYASE